MKLTNPVESLVLDTADPIRIDDEGCEVGDTGIENFRVQNNCEVDGVSDRVVSDDYDDESLQSPILFKLTGIDTSLGDLVLEDTLSQILSIPVTLLESDYNCEEGTILFCCSSDDSTFQESVENTSHHHHEQQQQQQQIHDRSDIVLERIAAYLTTIETAEITPTNDSSVPPPGNNIYFLKNGATNVSVEIVDEDDDEECVEYIMEEEAYQLWLEHNRCGAGDPGDDTGQPSVRDDTEIDLVSSPDGTLVRPTHGHRNQQLDGSDGGEELLSPSATAATVTATAKQLERDPGLFEFDNVERVHYTEVLRYLSDTEDAGSSNPPSSSSTWKDGFGSRPIIMHGLDPTTEFINESASPTPTSSLTTKDDSSLHEDLVLFQEALRDAIRRHGTDTIVRTGNRETLIQNGFHNSKPATLVDAGAVSRMMLHPPATTSSDHDDTIVFNPIHEMPPEFRSDGVLGRWLKSSNNTNTDANYNRRWDFPNRLWHGILDTEGPDDDDEEEDDDRLGEGGCDTVGPRFTLCIANEGFGIGMHKHGPALFFLTEGRKKWYLSHPGHIDDRIAAHERSLAKQREASMNHHRTGMSLDGGSDSNDNTADAAASSPTHPGFYRELSTHKCLQNPGELLLVPNLWYHEIYNLESPTIGIQALADALPVPGALSHGSRS